VLRGSVVRVDRFGNIVTNLDRRTCERLADGTHGLQLTVRGQAIARLVSTYSDIAPGEIGALFGSTDHLECAAHAASAAEQLGVAVGDPVELRRA
jgi:S-adenosyl-L-methionine hydrolase (adenosine-forming)